MKGKLKLKAMLSHLPDWQLVDLSKSTKQVLNALMSEVMWKEDRSPSADYAINQTIFGLTEIRRNIRSMLADLYVQCETDQCLTKQKIAWSRLLHDCDGDKYLARQACDESRKDPSNL